MTLEQLRIFVAVAECEHMTQGSQALNLTQSATSAAIATLEARHAMRLFDRVGRRIALTDAGRLFLVEARAVLARAGMAESVLADLAGLKRGSLAIAASQTVANYWLPAIIHRYQTLYPGIAVTLSIGNTQSVASSIHGGTADVGFVEGRIDDPALAVAPVGFDDMVLVVGNQHAWSRLGSVSPDQLAKTRWVLREPGSGTRSLLEEALAKFGLAIRDLDVAMELPSNEAVRSAVEAGAGASVISKLVAQASIRSGALIEVAIPLPKRGFFALRHKERYRTKAQDTFMKLIVAEVSRPATVKEPHHV